MRLPSLHGLFQKVRLWNVLHEALRRLWEARPVPQAWGFCKPDRRVSQKKAAPPLHKKIPVRVHFPQPVSVSGYKLLSLALPLPSQLSSDLLLSPPAPCSSPRLFLPATRKGELRDRLASPCYSDLRASVAPSLASPGTATLVPVV